MFVVVDQISAHIRKTFGSLFLENDLVIEIWWLLLGNFELQFSP